MRVCCVQSVAVRCAPPSRVGWGGVRQDGESRSALARSLAPRAATRGPSALVRAAKLAGYHPGEVGEVSGERQRARKSTRAAAACAASGSAANVRPTGSSSTLVPSFYSDVATRCGQLVPCSPARPRRMHRVPKLPGPPAPARAPCSTTPSRSRCARAPPWSAQAH